MIGRPNTEVDKVCVECGVSFRVKFCRSLKAKTCSVVCRNANSVGYKHSQATKTKIGLGNKGKPGNKSPKPEAVRLKMSAARRGALNPMWRGGVSSEGTKARLSPEQRKWRRDVLRRDNFTCQHCGIRGGYLHADHIEPFALFPELRLVLENGRTLCVPCHKKTPTYAGRVHKYCGLHVSRSL